MHATETIMTGSIRIDGIRGVEIGDIVILGIGEGYNIRGRVITIDGSHIIADFGASIRIEEIIADSAGKIITIEREGKRIISGQIEKAMKGSLGVEAVVKAAGHLIQG